MATATDQRSLRRRFFRLTGINILTNLTVPLAGLVDTALLGHLPDIRFLAGVALASLVFDVLYWSFGFLRMGTTGTAAQALGRGEAAEVYRVLYRSLVVAAALGAALVALAGPLGDLAFRLLGGAPGVEAAGREYFDARIWGAPAALANFAFLGWFLGREESGRALAMSATANLVNLGLDWLLIVELGMAAEGAGLATMASQYAQLAVALALFAATRRAPAAAAGGGALPGWSRAAVFDRERFAALFRLNRDILVRTVCLVGAFAVFTNASSLLGTAVLAANAILLRLFALASYSIDGAAFAAESLAGIFRGAGDRRSLARLTRLALATGAGFAALFVAVLFAAPGPVMALLTSHADVAARATAGLAWLAPVVLLGSLAFVWDGIFLGLTAGRALRNSMLVSLAVFLAAAWLALAMESNAIL
ncbi:MAG TPA: MATE family efflux transporter, partial [Thermoanaerobaculia bacterium]